MTTPVTLQAAQVAGFTTALDTLALRLAELGAQPLATAEMAGLSQPVATLSDFVGALREGLTLPLQAALSGSQSSAALLATLQAVAAAGGRVAISGVSDSVEGSGSESIWWVELTLDASETLVDYTLDPGLSPSDDPDAPSPGDRGLWVSELTTDVQASMSGVVRIGIVLDPAVPAEQALRLQIDDLTLSAAATAVVEDVQARFGVFGLGTTDASVSIDHQLKVDLLEPATGGVDLGTLTTAGAGSLFELTTAGSGLKIDLPFTLDLGGFAETGTAQQLSIVAADGFDASGLTLDLPALTLTGSGEPFDFDRLAEISVADLGAYLAGAQQLLARLGDGADVPLLGQSFSDALELAGPLQAALQALRDPGTGAWTFDTAQQMITALAAQLGLSESAFALRWSAVADAIEWDLPVQLNLATDASFDASAIVPSGSALQVSGQGSLSLNATLQATLTGGVASASSVPAQPVTASTLLSELNNGQGLTTVGLLGSDTTPLDDLRFALRDGTNVGFDLHALALGDGSNAGTATVQQLLDLLNTSPKLSASLVDSQLVIVDLTSGAGSFAVQAPTATVTVGEGAAAYPLTLTSAAPLRLGLALAPQEPDRLTGQTLQTVDLADRLYLVAQPVLTGSVAISGTLDAGASLGPLGLQVVDGELEGQAGWGVSLVDPVTGAADGRLYFSEVEGLSGSGVSGVLDAVLSHELTDPELEGIFQLKLTPDALASALDIDAADYSADPVDLGAGSPLAPSGDDVPFIAVGLQGSTTGDPWALTVTPSDKLLGLLDNGLAAFSFEDLPGMLALLLDGLEQTPLWTVRIPLVDRSVGELLALSGLRDALTSPDLATWLDPDAGTGLGDVSSGLATAVQAALADFEGSWAEWGPRIRALQAELGRINLAWDGRTPGDAGFVDNLLGRLHAWRADLALLEDGFSAALTAAGGTAPPSLVALGTALDQARGFADAIPTGLQALTQGLEATIEASLPGVDVTITPVLSTGTSGQLAFDIGLDLGAGLTGSVDLGELSLGADYLLDIETSGGLTYALDGALSTRIGWDLATMAPVFELADTSAALTLSLDDGPGLMLGAGLGGLASVSLGSTDPGRQLATIELTRSGSGSGPAEFGFAEGSFYGEAAFSAYLPLYVDPIAGTEPLAEVLVDASLEIQTSPTLTVSFDADVDADTADIAAAIAAGTLDINGWVDGALLFLKTLRSALESDLIGKLPFLRDADPALLDDLDDLLGNLEDVLTTAAALQTPQLLVTEVNAALATLPPAFSASVAFSLGGQPLDSSSPYWTQSFNDIYGDGGLDMAADELVATLQFDAELHEMLDAGTLDLGVPALGLQLDGALGIDLYADIGARIALGWSPVAGFFVDGVAGNEVEASLGVGFAPGSSLAMDLGPLRFELTDQTPGPNDAANEANRELHAEIGVDLGDGRLLGAGGTGLFSNAEFDVDPSEWRAQIGVDLTAGLFGSGPVLGTSLTMGYELPSTIATLADLADGEFSFEIGNAYVELGALLGEPVLQMLQRLQQVFEPIQPVLDVLTAEIPLVSDLSEKAGQGSLTLLDAIGLFGDGAETAAELLGVIAAIVNAVNAVETNGSNSLRFDLGALTPTDPNVLRGSTPVGESAFAYDGSGASDGDDPDSGGPFGGLLDTLRDIGLTFPILEDPGEQLFALLFGKDADLVLWDIPDVQASFDFRLSFPIIPPLYATLFGGVGFETEFDLGYDTRGIRQFIGDGADGSDLGLLLNGLYLVDEPGTEISLNATIGAGAEINVFVAKAGVEGGLRGELGADLKDPDDNGKVHVDELLFNLARGPECVFDFAGSLSVFLAAYIKIGFGTPFGFVTLFSERFNLVNKTLFDWSVVTCPPVDPVLAFVDPARDHDGNGATPTVRALVLNTGALAEDVLPGVTFDGDEVFTVDIARLEDGTPDPAGGLTVTGYSFTKTYSAADLAGVQWICFDAGVGNDTIVVTPEVTLPVWGRGGDGDDELVGGGGNNVLFGDGGSDLLSGRKGADRLVGGDGDDFVYGYGGADTLDGGEGADELFGDDDIGDLVQFNLRNPEFQAGAPGGDQILGGNGDDRVVAGSGNDQVRAGDGDDFIDAGNGTDAVQGDAGNDQILGGDGSDDLWGDDAAGTITVGSATENADKIEGGSGFNRIWGGPGNDVLYAADESQKAQAPASTPMGYSSRIDGGDGDDMLYGTAGADRLAGGFGSDYLESGTGADLQLGGPGNDALIAAGGAATLLGGHGDDVVDGGDAANWIEGGPGDDRIYARAGADVVYGGTTALGWSYLQDDLASGKPVIDALHGGFRATPAADDCAPEIFFYPEVYAPTYGPLVATVFADTDRDGVRDAVENAVPADTVWQVRISDAGRTRTLLDATLEGGTLTLAAEGLPAGDYWIDLQPVSGNPWMPSNATTSFSQLVSLDDSGDLPKPEFGYFLDDRIGQIEGRVTDAKSGDAQPRRLVFLDADADLERDAGERWTITDGKGSYRFDNLSPGQYLVVLDDITACEQLLPDRTPGWSSVKLDLGERVQQDFEVLTPQYPVVEGVLLGTGLELLTWHALPDGPAQAQPQPWQGDIRAVAIDLCAGGLEIGYDFKSMTVILEREGDEPWVFQGQQISVDLVEDVLSVRLRDPLKDGNYTLTLLSDGIESRNGLPLDGEWHNPSKEYPLGDRFESGDGKPGGDFVYMFTLKDDGTVAARTMTALWPDLIDLPTGNGTTVGAPAGSTITGSVWWHDADLPAGRDDTEPGIPGQRIELRDTKGNLLEVEKTAEDGSFGFDGLPAGTYVLRQVPEAPWREVVTTSEKLQAAWLAVQPSDVDARGASLRLLDLASSQADRLAELPGLAPRDLALVGEREVYVVGREAADGLPGLWRYDLDSGELVELKDPKWRDAPAVVALDQLDDRTLVALSEDGELLHWSMSAELWTPIGELRGPNEQLLLPVGDVAVVARDEAFTVATPAQIDPKQGPYQLLVHFNPSEFKLAYQVLLLREAPTRFVGLEWNGSTLLALGADGRIYEIDERTGAIGPGKTLEDLPPGTTGGLTLGLRPAEQVGRPGDVVVQVDGSGRVDVGFGDVPDITVLPDGNDWIDGGCGPQADFLHGDDGADLPSTLITVGGYDQIRGRDGNDTLVGGQKGDILRGEEGDDVIVGGSESANYLLGGNGQDSLTGGPTQDVIFGGDGNDTLAGLGGRDRLYGETSNDQLSGGDQDDWLVGGAGDDRVRGDAGDDQLVALYGEAAPSPGSAGDTYEGSAGADRLLVVGDWSLTLTDTTLQLDGSPVDTLQSVETAWLEGGSSPNRIDAGGFSGATWILGHDAADTLIGGSGTDRIDAGAGDDSVDGRGGNDTLDGGSGSNEVAGGSGDDLFLVRDASAMNRLVEASSGGNDRIDLTGVPVSWDVRLGQDGLRSVIVLERVTGTLRLDGSDSQFETLELGAGADQVTVAPGIDPGLGVSAGDGLDTVSYGGIDTIDPWPTPVQVLLAGGTATELAAAEGFEVAVGGKGADQLVGTAGDDTLDGHQSTDQLVGAGGNDTYLVDETAEVVTEAVGEGYDHVIASADFSLPAEVEQLTLTGSARQGTGNMLANLITGTAGDDTLDGLGGDDTLHGGEGNDELVGGDGKDHLAGELGDDRLAAGPGDDQVDGGAGTDTAVFVGMRADYVASLDTGTGVYTLTSALEGTDQVTGVEWFEFADRTLDGVQLLDITPPVLVDTVPAEGSSGAVPATTLELNFDEALERGPGSVRLEDADGNLIEAFPATEVVRVVISGSQLTIDPTADLLPGTTYRLVLEPGVVRDLSGNAFPAWSGTGFTVNATPTATALTLPETYTEDTPRDLADLVIDDVDGDAVAVTMTMSDPTVGQFSTGTVGASTSSFDPVTGAWSATGSVADLNGLLAALVFTPVPNGYADFSVSITIDDGVVPALTGTKTFTGVAVNDAPVAADVTATIDEDGSWTATLPAATDVEGDVVVYALATSPSHGSAAVAADGSVTYTPDADYHGTDSFDYQVDDGQGGVNMYTVGVTVTSVNDAPAFTLSSGVTVVEDAAATVAGLVVATYTAPTEEDSQTVTVAITSGTNTDGHYALDAIARQVTLTAAGATFVNGGGVLPGISLTATDDGTPAASSTQTVTPTTTLVNDPPVTSDQTVTMNEDGTHLGQIVASDVDGDMLSFAVQTPAAHGTLMLQADGSYSYAPAPDYAGSDGFQVLVIDPSGASALSTVTVTISPVNDAPVASGTSAYTRSTTTLAGQLPPASDVDGDVPSYALSSAPTRGTANVAADGSFTYTPAPSDFGPDTFSFAVDDGLGGTSTYAVVLWPESWLTIATMANAWFNGTFGNATMLALAGSVESFFLGDPDLFAAEVYNQYGSLFAPSDLAQSVANNLGLEGDANAALALRLRDALEAVTDPNPARVPYLRGQVLLDETEYFASLVDDPVYGEAARRFNAEIDAALKFANIPGTLNTATNADGSPVELPEETGDSTARVQGLRWGPVTGVAASENAPGRWPRGDGVVDDRLFGNASDEPGLDPRWLGDAPAPHGVAPTIELVAIPCLAQTETMGV